MGDHSQQGSQGASRRASSSPEVAPEVPPSPAAEAAPEAAETPQAYADQAREAYENPQEKIQPPSSRKVSLLSRSFSLLWEKFRTGTPLEKGLVVGGTALAIYASIKVVEKTIGVVRRSADALFSLGDTVDQGVERVQSASKEKLLFTLLGAAAMGGLLYLLIAKVDWGELMDEARQHPDGFVKGFLVAVSTRVALGVLDEPGPWWDDLATRFGLPNREKLRELREKGGETIQGAKTKLREATESIRDFDERSGLKALRERIFGYLDVDDRFKGWMESSVMTPLLALKDPQKVMEFLGLDTPEKRSEFYAQSLANAPTALGLGAGSYLFYRLIDSPWKRTMTGVNVALFMVMQNEGVSERVISGFEQLQATAESLRTEVNKILGHLGIQPEWVGLQDEGFGVKALMDLLFETAKDHPEFTVLALVNGAYLSRHVIRAVVLKSLKFIVMAPARTAQLIMEHKVAGGILIGVGSVAIIERRAVIEDLAHVLYPDSPEARREFMDDMYRYLEASKILEIPETPTALEAGMHPFYEALIKDPANFFTDPDRRFQLFEFVERGEINIFWDAAGNWLLAYGLGVNPIFHTLNLTQETVEAIFDEWETRGIRPDNIGLYATYTGEVVIGTAATIGAVRGYVALFNDFHGKTGRIPRILRASLKPNSPEWRFIFRSMARQTADVITLNQWTQFVHGYELNKFSFEVDAFLREADGILSRGKVDQSSTDKLIRYRDNARGLVSWLEAKGSTQEFVVSQDIKLQRELRGILEKLNSAIDKANSAANFNKTEFEALIRETRAVFERTQTRWARAFIVYQRIRDLYPFSARGASVLNRVSVSHGSEITPRQIDALKNNFMRTHAPELSRLGFSREAIVGLDTSFGMNEADILELIDEAKKPGSRIASQANELAYETRYAGQMRVVSRFHRYGLSLPVVIFLAHGFATSPTKVDFLTQFGIGAGGFTAGVGAVRLTEMAFSNKLPPVARVAADLAVGTVFAVGAGKFLDDYVISKLDYAFPNRNTDSWLNVAAHPLYVVGGGHAIDALRMTPIGMRVTEKTDPLEYLSGTIPNFWGTKDIAFRWDEDLAKNAAERIDKYKRKIEKWKQELVALDPSTQKALQMEADVREKEEAIVKLQTYVDGTWVDSARFELALMAAMIEPLKGKFMEGLGDQGRSFVSTLVSRIGTGQPLVDDGDKPIWERLLDSRPVKLDDDEHAYSFRDFVALVTYVKRREAQFKRLGYEPIRFSAEPEAPAEDSAAVS